MDCSVGINAGRPQEYCSRRVHSMRLRIFLSAVSSQFKDCRDALASDIPRYRLRTQKSRMGVARSGLDSSDWQRCDCLIFENRLDVLACGQCVDCF
jgi:hypothetical protein